MVLQACYEGVSALLHGGLTAVAATWRMGNLAENAAVRREVPVQESGENIVSPEHAYA